MKRLVVFYSLSGNTEEAAKTIAEKLGADLLKLETQKEMPKSFAARLFVGGGQVVFHHIPKLRPLDKEISDYDEIVLGSPIWNSKGVPCPFFSRQKVNFLIMVVQYVIWNPKTIKPLPYNAVFHFIHSEYLDFLQFLC